MVDKRMLLRGYQYESFDSNDPSWYGRGCVPIERLKAKSYRNSRPHCSKTGEHFLILTFIRRLSSTTFHRLDMVIVEQR